MLLLAAQVKAHEFNDNSGLILFHQGNGETIGISCTLDSLLSSTNDPELLQLQKELLKSGLLIENKD